jgi:hypothetical protein
MFLGVSGKQQATSPDVACVRTVERSFTLQVRIAVFTALSFSWRLIRQNAFLALPVVLFGINHSKASILIARVVPRGGSEQ